jgi:pimeloyl-ACP methyl ester carboxylesterase
VIGETAVTTEEVALMPRSRNRLDGRQVYFEDEGGDGAPVVFHGGFLDSVADVRESTIAQALRAGQFRRIYVDHRGLGASDKPHDLAAYAMEVRVGDAVGVLDELSIERAHFVGLSWGGRLGFGIGDHAQERVLSLVIGGQQPYEWPDSPLTRAVSRGLAAARSKGAEGVVEALEAFWDIRFPDERRARWVANDAAALEAAWTTAISEGPVSHDLPGWQVPCLIFMGAADNDFLKQAQRAARQIPTAEFLALDDANHYAAHTSQDELLIDAVLRTLRANS